MLEGEKEWKEFDAMASAGAFAYFCVVFTIIPGGFICKSGLFCDADEYV